MTLESPGLSVVELVPTCRGSMTTEYSPRIRSDRSDLNDTDSKTTAQLIQKLIIHNNIVNQKGFLSRLLLRNDTNSWILRYALDDGIRPFFVMLSKAKHPHTWILRFHLSLPAQAGMTG